MKVRTYEGCFAVWTALVACSCANHNPAAANTSHPGSSGGNQSGDDGSTPSGDDSGSGSDDGGVTQSATATLDDVTFTNIGRHGDVLFLTLDGTDSAGLTTEANVQVIDANSQPVIAFDTNWDGVADSSQKRFHFDTSTLGQTAFTGTITIPNVYTASTTIAAAIVSLSDVNGAVTSEITAPLIVQPTVALGAACDPTYVANRCADSQSCSAASICVAGVAPTISQVAYYTGSAPAQLFMGADPDQSLTSLTVTYLDKLGNPLSVDSQRGRRGRGRLGQHHHGPGRDRANVFPRQLPDPRVSGSRPADLRRRDRLGREDESARDRHGHHAPGHGPRGRVRLLRVLGVRRRQCVLSRHRRRHEQVHGDLVAAQGGVQRHLRDIVVRRARGVGSSCRAEPL